MHYFLRLQTLKLNNEKRKKSLFYIEKSLVGLTPGLNFINVYTQLLHRQAYASKVQTYNVGTKKDAHATYVRKS
jgi:hypothetical protein